MQKNKAARMRWLNIGALAVTLGVNALAELLPLGGVKTGEVSDAYPDLLTPEAGTFAIWGPIYLLLVGFAVYQAGALDERGGESERLLERVDGWFAASCAFNVAWLFCWHYRQIALSQAMLLGLLICLGQLVTKTRDAGGGRWGRWLGRAPFSLYFGWATVALLANVGACLQSLGLDGLGGPEDARVAALLALGAAFALIWTIRGRDWVYALGVVWGYGGVVWRHLARGGYDGAWPTVLWTAALGGAAVALAGACAGIWQGKEKARA